MPRRETADSLSHRIGARIAQLRWRAGLTAEQLAHAARLDNGHLSDTEHGLTRPTATTLQAVATALGVKVLDLVTFPEESDRQRLVELTRTLPPAEIARLLRILGKADYGSRKETATLEQPRPRPTPTHDGLLYRVAAAIVEGSLGCFWLVKVNSHSEERST